MKNLLLLSIASLLLIASYGCDQEAKLDHTFRKSVEWLWAQQSEDGGWHSQTHNVLQDGRVLTPYILYYLMQVPNKIYPTKKEALQRGIDFIEHDIWERDTFISENYPNYSAAYALRIYTKTGINDWRQWKLARYLQDQQFTESRGVTNESMAYGGWGYGEVNLKTGDFGHVDISHTRRITESIVDALKHPGVLLATSHEIKTVHDTDFELNKFAILRFLQSVQRSPNDDRLYEGCTDRSRIPYDGGFVSSMYTLSTNKCQPYNLNDCYYYPSYATATCDGLLTFLAIHATMKLPSASVLNLTTPYEDAVKWLTDHQRIDVIDGLSKDDPEQWYLIMHYYHWAVRAEAMKAAGIEGPWEKDMIKALIKEQQFKGFYINPIGGVNKEDDPLMSTIFCVQAMTALHSS